MANKICKSLRLMDRKLLEYDLGIKIKLLRKLNSMIMEICVHTVRY